MSGNREVLYYRLTPVFKPQPGDPPQMASAAMQYCMATGRTLSSSGGGGLALDPEIVNALDMSKSGGKPKAVVGAEDLQTLVDAVTHDFLPNITPDTISREDREDIERIVNEMAPGL